MGVVSLLVGQPASSVQGACDISDHILFPLRLPSCTTFAYLLLLSASFSSFLHLLYCYWHREYRSPWQTSGQQRPQRSPAQKLKSVRPITPEKGNSKRHPSCCRLLAASGGVTCGLCKERSLILLDMISNKSWLFASFPLTLHPIFPLPYLWSINCKGLCYSKNQANKSPVMSEFRWQQTKSVVGKPNTISSLKSQSGTNQQVLVC